MKINYGINKKIGRRIVHENHSLDLPQYADKDWDENFQQVFQDIRRRVTAAHPGWALTGCALVRERQPDTTGIF